MVAASVAGHTSFIFGVFFVVFLRHGQLSQDLWAKVTTNLKTLHK
jgi:hypothetical protein